MATYDFVQSRIYRLLNDPNGSTYSDELVYDGLLAAQEAILPWVPKKAVQTVTSGSDGYLLVLPSDLYMIQAIREVETGKFLLKGTMAPGTVRHDDYQTFLDWIDYPDGYVSFNYQVDEGSEYEVYYFAHWGIPSNASDITFVMEVPQYAHQGLVYYAGAHVLIPSAVNSATIRQFNLRVDSGDPEHNPLKVEADYLRSLFFTEMKLMPPYVKVIQQ
jgi:hypothetical protein